MSEQHMEVEILIIGAGPGGMAAGIYAGRARRKSVILDKSFPGGQLAFTAHIENYPGFLKGNAGMDLANQMAEQAQHFGVEIRTEEVRGIEMDNRRFVVTTDRGVIRADAVIVATGAKWKKLDVPGEEEFSGRGVSYCGTCDSMLYMNKEIVVVGGGDTALDEALFLTRFVKKLHIIHRRDQLRAEKILQERAFADPKIGFIWDSVVTKITGGNHVDAVELLNKKTGETSVFSTEGVFIFVGNIPNIEFLPESVKKNEQGQIITNLRMETSVPGLYAVGDVRDQSIRQVVAATGDGATAAWYADKYLEK